MSHDADPAQVDADDEGGSVSPVDFGLFVLRAARRHSVVGVLLTIVVGALATFIAKALPPHFEAFARVSVPPNMVAATALGRTEQIDPLKGLDDVVYSDENLDSITKELKLLEVWEKGRSPLMHAKDVIFSALFGPVSRKDKERALRILLKRSIQVGSVDGAISFRAEWQDPQTAFDLCRLMKRNFLGHRSTQELAAITTAIAVLEDELKRAGEALDPALDGARKAREKALRGLGGADKEREPAPAAAPATARRAATGAQSSPAAGRQISAKLDEVRQKEAAIRDPWQRRLAELRFQLNDLKATFGPEHPSVKQQEARIASASVEPPELAELAREERSLLEDLRAVGAGAEPSARVGGSIRSGTSDALPALDARDRERLSGDPEVLAAEGRLNAAVSKYNDMSSQLEAARLELATAQAAFKYKYVTVSEPEVPTKPYKPRRGLIMVGGWVAALGLGLIIGAVIDLLSGRMLEGWQLRRLGVPVLAEIDLNKRLES